MSVIRSLLYVLYTAELSVSSLLFDMGSIYSAVGLLECFPWWCRSGLVKSLRLSVHVLLKLKLKPSLKLAAWDFTRPRPRSCGLNLDNGWPELTLMRSLSCRRELLSSTLEGISTASLSTNYQYILTGCCRVSNVVLYHLWLLGWNQRTSIRCFSESAVKTLIQASVGLLQLTVLYSISDGC